MQALVERLARRSNRNGVPWRVNVVRNRAANAFAIGAGYIYVTDGALTFVEDESELAAILAHEMGHQLSGHFCRQGPPPSLWSGLFGGGAPALRTRGVGSLSLVVDLAKEQEADRRALDLLIGRGLQLAGDAGGGQTPAIGRFLRPLARPPSNPGAGELDGRAIRHTHCNIRRIPYH